MHDLRSAVSHVTWPALPGMMESQILAQLYQLERSQWWPAAVLAEAQGHQLRSLMDHTVRTVPFYRQRFAEAGLPLAAEVLVARWSEVPVLTRPEVQAAGGALRSEAMPAGHGEPVPIETSGSTGRPIRTLTTAITRLDWMAHTLRDHLWHDWDPLGHLVGIRPDRKAEDGASDRLPSWGPPVDRLFRTGTSALLNSRTGIERQVQWLREQEPSYLLSLPSNVRALAEHCRDTGVRLPGLRAVRTLGEPLGPELRDLCRSVWDVPVTDFYSAQEVGYIALQCPEHEHYHIQAEHLLVEVLDEAGQPCESGEMGRLVLTTLRNFATPLIRYEIMDYVEVGETCPCGRGLPVIRRVLGRHRNMAVSPDGDRFYPSFPAEAWAHIAPIRQIQMVQKARDRIEVRLVADRELEASERQRLGQALRDSLGYPFAFSFSRHAEIARSASGKYEDFISEI